MHNQPEDVPGSTTVADIASRTVTMLPNLFKPSECAYETLAEVIARIHSCPRLRADCEILRKTFAREGNSPGYKAKKKTLPTVIFSGRFSNASDAGLMNHAGLMVIDFDKLNPLRLTALSKQLTSDPHTVVVFVSPSGAGLKWVVAVKAHDQTTHKHCFEAINTYAHHNFKVVPDPSGSDVSRKCFLAHDPSATLINPLRTFTPASLPKHGRTHTAQQTTDSLTAQHPDSLTARQPDSLTNTTDVAAAAVLTPSDLLWLEPEIQKRLPRGSSQNHQSIFATARLCREVESRYLLPNGSINIEDQQLIFAIWYRQATPFLTGTESDYWDEFQEAVQDAKSSPMRTPIQRALEAAKSLPPPREALQIFPYPNSEHKHFIVSVAHLQARERGEQAIILPVNEIINFATKNGIADLAYPPQIARPIKAMINRRLLRKTKDSNLESRQASEYQYRGRIYSDDELRAGSKNPQRS